MNTDALFEYFIKEHLANPTLAKQWHIYEIHHIDVLDFFVDAEKVFSDKLGIHALFNAIRATMIQAGWEGDGDLQVMWLPSFSFRSAGSLGEIIWHVKQMNNGTSYVVSEWELDVTVERKLGKKSTIYR